MYSSAIRGCHEEGSADGTAFRDFLNMPGHTKLIPWPGIRAVVAKLALDRQAWRDAKKMLCGNLRSLNRSRPGAVCNDCDLAAEDVEVTASATASVKSKE
eukprot:363828-Chlamydomonas_euryale.AAC.16